ncbi:MAG TPA: cytidylate kinase-like family protein [Gemmatimonadaceae bacterium]|nr:cytidylate kinase-like family protein [Gemmatimonadaceae bacterium]
MSIVTVSRLYGSGGSEVAARVARELRWSLLDNAVVDAVAERLGIAPSQVAAREERVPSLVKRLVDTMALGSQEWLTPIAAANRAPTDEQLVEVTRHIVEEAIARGPLVIVGRGAQAMLAERTDALHVFCYASRAALIARAMERDHTNEEKAARRVDETNEQREQWVRRHWNRAWRAHENYHLSVNTEWLGLEGAADVITAVARQRFVDASTPG